MSSAAPTNRQDNEDDAGDENDEEAVDGEGDEGGEDDCTAAVVYLMRAFVAEMQLHDLEISDMQPPCTGTGILNCTTMCDRLRSALRKKAA